MAQNWEWAHAGIPWYSLLGSHSWQLIAAHSWAGVRFSSFPYLLTKTALMCYWPTLTILFCVCSCLPISFPTRLSCSIPCFHLLCCHRNPFWGRLRLYLHTSSFLCSWNAKGWRQERKVLCQMAGASVKQLFLSSPCLEPFPLDWIWH